MRTRINHLNALIKEYKDRFKFTTFVLEDGSPFITDSDPLQYLMEHGVQTPRGRIVAYACDKKELTRSRWQSMRKSRTVSKMAVLIFLLMIVK